MIKTGPQRASNFIFVATVFLVALPAFVTAQNLKHNSVPFVDYCSLFSSTDSYKNRTFSTRALMFYSNVSRVDGEDTFLYSANCNSGDYFSVFGEGNKGWDRWRSFFRSLEDEKRFVLEIEFEGKIDFREFGLFGSLDGWARSQITLSRIISIKNVTGTLSGVESNDDAPSPLTNQVTQVTSDGMQFLHSLVSEPPASEILLPTFVFIDGKGRPKTKDEYLAINGSKLDILGAKSGTIRNAFVGRIKNQHIQLGTIEETYEDGRTKTFRCEMIFQLVDGKWKLSQAKMK